MSEELREQFEKETGIEPHISFNGFDPAYVEWLESKLKAVEELLQYVADNHLCGTPLIEGMKKVGIKEQLIRTDELKKQSLNK